jgi:hypothetical protein
VQAYLKASYKRSTNNGGYREEHLVRCITIPVELLDVEFYAESEGSALKIVSVKARYQIHEEDPKEIWVSPKELYDCVDQNLDDDKYFWVWCKTQWLRQKDPGFDEKFNEVHDRIVNGDLEDQDAFDAVEGLGFPRWAADVLLNG